MFVVAGDAWAADAGIAAGALCRRADCGVVAGAGAGVGALGVAALVVVNGVGVGVESIERRA